MYQVHKYYNHLKKIIKMAVILMDLLHTEILLRFILLSNVIFEFVSIFCRQFARFSPFLVGLVRQDSLGLSAKLNTNKNLKFESLIFFKSIYFWHRRNHSEFLKLLKVGVSTHDVELVLVPSQCFKHFFIYVKLRFSMPWFFRSKCSLGF